MTVTVIECGLDGLFSVSRALEHAGTAFVETDSATEIERARRMIPSGIGAFRNGRNGLNERGLIEPVRQYAASGRPMLGICVGTQLPFGVGEVFGRRERRGLISRRAMAIWPTGNNGPLYTIPHIGRNELVGPASRFSWDRKVLVNVEPGASVYFGHSFTADPAYPLDCLPRCYYDGQRISAGVNRGSLSSCQFHPETSGDAGLNILRAFLALSARPVPIPT